MGENTAIEWAHHTVNFWWGCTKVSPGCANCYAEKWSARWDKRLWGPGAERERKPKAANLARKLDRQAARQGSRYRVFCASMSDWLDPEAPVEWLADLLAVVAETPNLDWLLLTKRPQLWRERIRAVHDMVFAGEEALEITHNWLYGRPPANVWVGTSVEDQQRADERIPHMLGIPARVRFLSCEPLLGSVALPVREHVICTNCGEWNNEGGDCPECGAMEHQQEVQDVSPDGIHWVIAGGESGHGARPMHPEWARSLRDQCQAAGVSFFFKQWGAWVAGWYEGYDPGELPPELPDGPTHDWGEGVMSVCVGKGSAGRLLDGRTWDEVPS